MKFFIVAFLAFTVAADAQTIGFGGCNKKVQVQKDFDVNRYMGKWYEVERIPNTFQSGLYCSQAEYTLTEDNGKIEVINKGLKLKTGEVDDITGEMKIVGPSDAQLGVRFFSLQPLGPYWVLDTDYDTYTVVWSCSSVGVAHAEFLWIMSRERPLSDETLEKIHGRWGKSISIDKLQKAYEDPEACAKDLP